MFHRRGEELAKAAEALQATTHEVERFMNDLRQPEAAMDSGTSSRFCGCDWQAEKAVNPPLCGEEQCIPKNSRVAANYRGRRV